MVAWLGPAISAAGNLIGGIIGNSASDDASDFAAKQFRFQNLAAKKSIQWRVKDAREAGVHPIYALGAQAFSPSPVSISGSAPLADGIAAMGQDIGRAVTAGQSAHLNQAEKLAQGLALERAGLENKLIAGQIAALEKATAQTSVPGQGNALDPDPENITRVFGKQIVRDPLRHSSAQKHQDQGGELAEWLAGTVGWLESIFASMSPEGARGHGIDAGWKKRFYDRPPTWMRGLGGRTYR